jgi:hypothetical protein
MIIYIYIYILYTNILRHFDLLLMSESNLKQYFMHLANICSPFFLNKLGRYSLIKSKILHLINDTLCLPKYPIKLFKNYSNYFL